MPKAVPLSWEEVLKDEKLIGRNVEFRSESFISRGPLQRLYVAGPARLVCTTEWRAWRTKENRKYSLSATGRQVIPYIINTDVVTPYRYGQTGVWFKIPKGKCFLFGSERNLLKKRSYTIKTHLKK